MGVTIDPSFDFPLPIFGINYLDFGVHDKNTQLAVLFGGVLVLANLQHTKVFGGPLDASVDLFAIAVPSNDRVYGATGEREAERLLTWPFNIGGNLGWQMNDFHKLTANYQFHFDGYHADTTTVDAFVIPQSTITNGIGAGYEFKRYGYSLTANGTWYGRVGWKAWGLGGLEPPRTELREVQPQPVKGLLLERVQQAAPEWGLFRRRQPRSLHAVSIRAVR